MKRIFLPIIGLALLSSCQGELYRDNTEIHEAPQGVYISKSSAQVFVQEGATKEVRDLRVSLARKSETSQSVSLSVGVQADLDAYNKLNGTEYQLLPQDQYEAPTSVTFAEQTATATYPVTLKNVQFKPGVLYALPVRLQGDDAIPGQDLGIITLDPITYTKAGRFSGSGAERADMFSPALKVNKWTMEMMVNRQNYSSNNRALGGTKGNLYGAVDEIFTRFGDVTIDPNQLQMKTLSANHDVPKDKLAAKAGEWYMLSLVYDASTIKIYVNGSLAYSNVVRENQEYGMTGFWLSGNNELMREFRFYSTARTAKQIADYVWKTADYTDPNLVVYYPFNGKKLDHETGAVTEDETMIWDWSKNAKHLNKPNGFSFMNNTDGNPFVFPLDAK